MRTLIKIAGSLDLVIDKNKKETLLLVKSFLEDKIVTNTNHHKSLGVFNGMRNLTSRLIQFLENKEDESDNPASIWVCDGSSEHWYDDVIVITKGESLSLSKKEINLIKEGVLDFHIYGTINNSFLVEIDGKQNIKKTKVEAFKKEFNERYRNYEATKQWPS